MTTLTTGEAMVKKFENLKGGTLVILGGLRLYKGGMISFNEDDYEKNKSELQKLVVEGFIKEVELSSKPKSFEPQRTPDVLDQDDDLDPNIFVKQKQPNIFNPNPPEKKLEEEVESKSEDSDTIPDNVIDVAVKSLPDTSKDVEDGYDGKERTITCVSGITDWRKAKQIIENEVKDIGELDKIIKYDHRPTVSMAAAQKKELVLSGNSGN
jgi:hypothetical protein